MQPSIPSKNHEQQQSKTQPLHLAFQTCFFVLQQVWLYKNCLPNSHRSLNILRTWSQEVQRNLFVVRRVEKQVWPPVECFGLYMEFTDSPVGGAIGGKATRKRDERPKICIITVLNWCKKSFGYIRCCWTKRFAHPNDMAYRYLQTFQISLRPSKWVRG